MNAWSQQRLEWCEVCNNADNALTLTGPDRAAEQFRALIEANNGYEFEHLMAVFMNHQSKLVGSCVFGLGGFAEVKTSSAILFKKFYTAPGATCMIIGHNHPSGSLKPSLQDISFATMLNNAGRFLDVRIIDHLIVTHNNFTRYHVPSDRETQILDFKV